VSRKWTAEERARQSAAIKALWDDPLRRVVWYDALILGLINKGAGRPPLVRSTYMRDYMRRRRALLKYGGE
jgi:hypothetical protein